jgi:hypothetical protein
MTRAEYYDILYAIDTVENQEKTYCARYVELNPEDKARRERDKDLVILGLMHLRYEIQRRFENRIETAG